MTNTTDTQSTAILTIIKNGAVKSTQRFASVETATVNRDALALLLPGHTFGLIIDTTDKETASTRGVTFEVESANGKTKHNIPSYGLARSYARRYATADNAVTIRQMIILEDVEDLTEEGVTAEAYAEA